MDVATPDLVFRIRKGLGGISQESLARIIHVTLKTVSRWESGDPIPAEALAKLYQASSEADDRELAYHCQLAINARLYGGLQFAEMVPQTMTEMLLVGEFLRRLREDDGSIDHIVAELHRFVKQRQQKQLKGKQRQADEAKRKVLK